MLNNVYVRMRACVYVSPHMISVTCYSEDCFYVMTWVSQGGKQVKKMLMQESRSRLFILTRHEIMKNFSSKRQ